jgi:hypothetical protein
MFAFMAIDPTIEHVADENRIFRINLIKADDEARRKYKTEYKPALKKLLGYDQTRAIRALVWRELKGILARAHDYADVIQETSGNDSRYSLAEGILQSVYWTIWRNQPERSVLDMSRSMVDLYSSCPAESPRDEAAELLDRILDRRVQIERPERESVSLREICYALKNGAFEHQEETASPVPKGLSERDDITHLRGVINRHGVSLVGENGDVAIDTSSDEIIKWLNVARGYHRLLYRHDDAEPNSITVNMAGKTRRCVLIKGVVG